MKFGIALDPSQLNDDFNQLPEMMSGIMVDKELLTSDNGYYLEELLYQGGRELLLDNLLPQNVLQEFHQLQPNLVDRIISQVSSENQLMQAYGAAYASLDFRLDQRRKLLSDSEVVNFQESMTSLALAVEPSEITPLWKLIYPFLPGVKDGWANSGLVIGPVNNDNTLVQVDVDLMNIYEKCDFDLIFTKYSFNIAIIKLTYPQNEISKISTEFLTKILNGLKDLKFDGFIVFSPQGLDSEQFEHEVGRLSVILNNF